MALGTNIYNQNMVKFLKLRLKGGARFAIMEKNSEGKSEEKGSVKIVNGALKKVEIQEGEYEGNKIYNLKINIVDGSESYFVDINTMSSVGRSCMSSLLSLTEYGKIIQLSLYTSKYTDRNGKPATSDKLGVMYDGQLLKWKYNIGDKTNSEGLPEVRPVKIQGKDSIDSYDRDMFLMHELGNHLALLPEPTTLQAMPTNVVSNIDEGIIEEDLSDVFGSYNTTSEIDISDKAF